MKLSKATHLRGMVEKAADRGLEDADALEAPELFPQWDGGANYEAGQRVRHEGILYRCLQGHQAQPGWTPTAAPSLWARVLIEDPDVIPEWVQPDSTNGYKLGDKVRHNGKVWESVFEGSNVWEPGVYGWVEVIE